MPFDGIFLYKVVENLNKELTGARINKIGMPGDSEVAIIFNSKKKLLINIDSNMPHITLTNDVGTNPDNPPNFLLFLRKYLQKGIINKITQHGLDRVVTFEITSFDDIGYRREYKLIVEIMGKHSNIILVDSQGIIVDAIKRITPDLSSKRLILSGLKYNYFDNGKIDFRTNDFNFLNDEFSLIDEKKIYSKYEGFSPILASYLLNNCKNTNDLNILSKEILNSNSTFLFTKDNIPSDFHIVNFDDSGTEYENIFELINTFYSQRSKAKNTKGKVTDLKKLLENRIERLMTKISILSNEMNENLNNEKYKQIGDIIMANIYTMKSGIDSVNLYDFYNDTNIEIKLDPFLSSTENANYYYKKFNKQKTANIHLNEQILKANEEIQYLDTIFTNLDNNLSDEEIIEIRQELYEQKIISSKPKIQKNKKSDILKINIEGFTVLIGKNNFQNDMITFKLSQKDDIWFHVKGIPGSHILLKGEGEADEEIQRKCSSLAAYFSKARNSSSVPVDITYIKNVKKPPGAKPGYVTYKDQTTMYVTPNHVEIYEMLKK